MISEGSAEVLTDFWEDEDLVAVRVTVVVSVDEGLVFVVDVVLVDDFVKVGVEEVFRVTVDVLELVLVAEADFERVLETDLRGDVHTLSIHTRISLQSL